MPGEGKPDMIVVPIMDQPNFTLNLLANWNIYDRIVELHIEVSRDVEIF